MKKSNRSTTAKQSAKSTKVDAGVPVKKANEYKQGASKVESTLKNPNVLYLAEGKRGKDLQREKIDSNRMNKAELQSLSFCLNQFKKHGSKYLACFKGSKMEDLTPKNLIPHISEVDAKRQANNGGKWSYFMLETTIGRYYKSKAKK